MSNRISSIFDLKIQGFLQAKKHPNKEERSSCRNARNTTKPQFLLGFYHFADNAHKAKNNQTKRKIEAKMDVFWDLGQNLVLGAFRRPKTVPRWSQDGPKMAPKGP